MTGTNTTSTPTADILEKHKLIQDGITFWKTIDFFPYDKDKAEELASLLALTSASVFKEDEQTELEQIAQHMGLSFEKLRQQLDNYTKVTQTPFCLWEKNAASGDLEPVFFASLDAISKYSKPAPRGIKFITTRIAPAIWAIVVVVVIIPMIGQWLMVRSLPEEAPQSMVIEAPSAIKQTAPTIQVEMDWNRLEDITKEKMRRAQVKAEFLADQELDKWTDNLTQRLDNSFLDWYFGYFHQKQLQYQSFFAGISGQFKQWLDPNNPSPQEKIAEEITTDFQEEFAKRVLVPQISELQLQNITVKVAKAYIHELGQELNQIPVEVGISAAEWNRYLQETAISIPSTVGAPLQLPLKQITTVGAYVALKPLIMPLLPKVGTALAAKLAAKAGAKLATKTAATLATKLGGTFLDATVGAGIIIWDVWDNHHTASIEKPILRQNLVDYIAQIQESVLQNPDNGIMTITDKINDKIFWAFDVTRDMDKSSIATHL